MEGFSLNPQDMTLIQSNDKIILKCYTVLSMNICTSVISGCKRMGHVRGSARDFTLYHPYIVIKPLNQRQKKYRYLIEKFGSCLFDLLIF